MKKAAIINVTGYSGIELARILHRHPDIELTQVTGRSAVGQKLGEAFPHLSDIDMEIEAEVTESVDVVFSALPQTASAEALIPLVEQGVKSIDISADFRLKDATEYEDWYGVAHPKAQLLEESVYGLTELNRSDVRSATLVANPGCYPTGAILALAPAVREGLIHEDIIIDAKSGVSGAGRGLSLNTHFSEVNENVSAYSVSGHRHLPEITQELRRVRGGFDPKITFLPHLIPMTRGILDSCYATLKDGAIASGPEGIKELRALYESFYRDEPFVQVVGSSPMTKHTLGNNNCVIYPTVDLRTNRLMVVSCLDNLVKGAAGQAIQNMNLMLGLEETEGLEQLALYP
ncbi:MAG: N-acetyl-gamma-glutamyl-phosphate reductase [Chloroflexota bacterium]|nr:N-acetyl-gamma-glutamyl-phosphate reductase [Chloroflexota bacterium]MDE2942140.1 N-acetyl-gamma-glutamyl-phosphate reductase [Chloroflexota bacterium]MDE3268028.1 N-acetyl-gamma-glutamyl-phosphate reductase [Chloroflexota bacterium]